MGVGVGVCVGVCVCFTKFICSFIRLISGYFIL